MRINRGLFLLALMSMAYAMSACTVAKKDLDFTDDGTRQRFLELRSPQFSNSLTKIREFKLVARLIIKSQNDRQRLNLKWDYTRSNVGAPEMHEITVYDRLGRTRLSLVEDHQGARLLYSRRETEHTQAASLSELIAANTGLDIPVSRMTRWLLALDLTDEEALNSRKIMSDDGWLVEYLNFATFGAWLMPQRLRVSGSGQSIEMTITKWTFPVADSEDILAPSGLSTFERNRSPRP